MNRRELLTSVAVAALAPRLGSGLVPRLGSERAARTVDATLVQEPAAIGADQGELVYVPQGTWHGGRNTGSGTLKWVAI